MERELIPIGGNLDPPALLSKQHGQSVEASDDEPPEVTREGKRRYRAEQKALANEIRATADAAVRSLLGEAYHPSLVAFHTDLTKPHGYIWKAPPHCTYVRWLHWNPAWKLEKIMRPFLLEIKDGIEKGILRPMLLADADQEDVERELELLRLDWEDIIAEAEREDEEEEDEYEEGDNEEGGNGDVTDQEDDEMESMDDQDESAEEEEDHVAWGGECELCKAGEKEEDSDLEDEDGSSGTEGYSALENDMDADSEEDLNLHFELGDDKKETSEDMRRNYRMELKGDTEGEDQDHAMELD